MLKIPFRTTRFSCKLAPSALVFKPPASPPPPPQLKTRSAIPEDKNDHDYEILLEVFSRILKNRHFGKLH